MSPAIPYISIAPLHILRPLRARGLSIPELSIKPFGTLVALGVFVASELIKRQGIVQGLDPRC